MTKIIYKYPLEVTNYQDIYLPDGATILHVNTQMQGDVPTPCLWALVDTSKKMIANKIRIIGTGHIIDEKEDLKYLGTFIQDKYGFVGHVFLLT